MKKAAPKKTVRGVTVDDLRPFIEWLDSKQSPKAYVTQFGVGKEVGDFYIMITPHGPFNSEASLGGSVMIFQIREGARKTKKAGWTTELLNGITPRTRNALQRLIEEITGVHSAWNGVGKECETCSFHIAKDTGPDVARAYKNYHGHPDHSRPFVKGLPE